jgi:hypothetical protein
MAKSADATLHSTLSDEDKAAKIGTARFFCEQILPSVHGLSAAVMGDDALLMSFDHAALAK